MTATARYHLPNMGQTEWLLSLSAGFKSLCICKVHSNRDCFARLTAAEGPQHKALPLKTESPRQLLAGTGMFRFRILYYWKGLLHLVSVYTLVPPNVSRNAWIALISAPVIFSCCGLPPGRRRGSRFVFPGAALIVL